MSSTIFVTGGTGQTGANVCQQLIERGDDVRALVRNTDEALALKEIGVELVKGDISDADDFRAVNMVGTCNVLEAAKAHGMRRAVALSTATMSFDDGLRLLIPWLRKLGRLE